MKGKVIPFPQKHSCKSPHTELSLIKEYVENMEGKLCDRKKVWLVLWFGDVRQFAEGKGMQTGNAWVHDNDCSNGKAIPFPKKCRIESLETEHSLIKEYIENMEGKLCKRKKIWLSSWHRRVRLFAKNNGMKTGNAWLYNKALDLGL